MIRRLQKKFITMTAAALFCVLFLLIFALNGLNIYASLQELNRTMNMIVENDGVFPNKNPPPSQSIQGSNPPEYEGEEHPAILGMERQNREKYFTTRFCSVTLNKDMSVTDVNTERIAAISADEARAYTDTILRRNSSEGWIHNYRYCLSETGDGYLLILLDGSTTLSSVFTVLFISLLAAMICYLLVLVIIVRYSRKAIGPIAESYEKQKLFITDASHELKTPITIISANAELLSMSSPDEDGWIQGILRQTLKMQHMVNQLVTLSRMDEENQPLVFQDFCISDALYDTAMVFDSLCQKTGYKFHIDVESGLTMNGDESSLRQLFSILLDNAVKYCDAGGMILITLKREKCLVLKICNTFKDVDNLVLNKLFDRFYRNDLSRAEMDLADKCPGSEKKGGYGLGLAIAKSIVHNHHGKIRAVKSSTDMISFEVRF